MAETVRRAWSLGAGPGGSATTIDLDSTICEVHGKQGGCRLWLHQSARLSPPLGHPGATGEVLHARLRKGSSQRELGRFTEELIARVCRAGATGPLVVRAEPGFFSYALVDILSRLGVSWSDHGHIGAPLQGLHRGHRRVGLADDLLSRWRRGPGGRDNVCNWDPQAVLAHCA